MAVAEDAPSVEVMVDALDEDGYGGRGSVAKSPRSAGVRALVVVVAILALKE